MYLAPRFYYSDDTCLTGEVLISMFCPFFAYSYHIFFLLLLVFPVRGVVSSIRGPMWGLLLGECQVDRCPLDVKSGRSLPLGREGPETSVGRSVCDRCTCRLIPRLLPPGLSERRRSSLVPLEAGELLGCAIWMWRPLLRPVFVGR